MAIINAQSLFTISNISSIYPLFSGEQFKYISLILIGMLSSVSFVPYKNNRGNLSSNKYNPNTIFQVIAVIAVSLLLWKTAEHISLKRQIDEYENQDAVEKTIDAADSWLDKVDLNIFDLIGF